jgi:hypothetical protein
LLKKATFNGHQFSPSQDYTNIVGKEYIHFVKNAGNPRPSFLMPSYDCLDFKPPKCVQADSKLDAEHRAPIAKKKGKKMENGNLKKKIADFFSFGEY